MCCYLDSAAAAPADHPDQPVDGTGAGHHQRATAVALTGVPATARHVGAHHLLGNPAGRVRQALHITFVTA